MVDTVRTLSALQALLADNTSKQISPQDVRDFLVSVYPRNVEQGALPTSGWSWVNQGSATVTSVNGTLSFASPAVGANNLIAYVRTAPSTPYVITAEFVGTRNATDTGYGLCFRESSTGELTVLMGKRRAGNEVITENWNSPTSFNATLTSPATEPTQRVWFQIEDDGTDLFFRYGFFGDDSALIDVTNIGRTSFMAGGPDQIGIIARDNSVAVRWACLSWIEA